MTIKELATFTFILLSASLFSGSFERIPAKYQNTCQRIQLQYDIPDWILYAVPMKESSWNQNAISHADCIGLMQIHPKYIDYFVEQYWTGSQEFDVYNAYHNLWMGFAYLSDLKDRFKSWELALAAYNAGPTRVARWDIPEETIGYIVDIKNMRVNNL